MGPLPCLKGSPVLHVVSNCVVYFGLVKIRT